MTSAIAAGGSGRCPAAWAFACVALSTGTVAPFPPEGGDTVLSLALTVQASGVRVAERGVADAPLRSSCRQGLSPTPEATSSARRRGAVGVQRGAHPSRSPAGHPGTRGRG